MSIEKEREAFENLWLAGGGNFDNFIFSEDQGKYAAIENSNLTDKQKEMALYVVNNAYLFFVGGFKQAAKAQAVPEGFVLVPVDQLNQWGHMANYAEQYGCCDCFESRGYAHNLACEINSYFEPVEAQEQSHD